MRIEVVSLSHVSFISLLKQFFLNPGHLHNEILEQDVYNVSLCDISWQSTNIHRSASRLGEAWVVRERVLDMLFVLLNAGKVAFTIDTNN